MRLSAGRIEVDDRRAALSLGFLVILAGASAAAVTGVWIALARASAAGEVVPTSEWRIVIATSVAAIVSLGSALLSWIGQGRGYALDLARKGLELNTQASFDLWKSCVAAYRLLDKAQNEEFERSDLAAITANFEESERQTLLLDEETLDKYQLYWQESERIGSELLDAHRNKRAQSEIWADEVDGYEAKHDTLKALIKSAVTTLPRVG